MKMNRRKIWQEKSVVFAGISLVLAVLSYAVYQLWFAFAAVFFLACNLMLPKIYRYMEAASKEEKRYQDMTIYMEQLLCSYKRTSRLLDSVLDCQTLFSETGEMGGCISAGLHIMKTGEGVADGEIARRGFEKIEEKYSSRRLVMLHDFLCEAEKMGGQREQAVDILLEDLQMWKSRTSLYQKKKSFIRIETLIALVLAFIMCYVSKLLTPEELGFRLSDTMFYQIVTTIVFCGFIVILSVIWKKLTGSWLDEREKMDAKEKERQQKQYEMIKGRRKSKKIEHRLAKRICKRQVERDFPYWLLSITLFLQTDSVYQAMKNSINKIKGIFAAEVEELLANIYEHPNLLSPYTAFFRELSMPEVQTGMKILYSVNQNGYEDSKKQLDFLVSQNNQLMDRAESNRYENQTAGLSMLKHLPMMAASIKLLADLINLLILTMGSFQNLT